MGALNGIKILDFTTLLPGPFATLTLADLGAEVVKISSPSKPDLVTSWPPQIEGENVTAAAAWLGRNKKTVHLDLKAEGGKDQVERLIDQGYNIIVEQFRPGVMDRLGLGYQELSSRHPDLIYCSITGYGQTGPMKDKAGHDMNFLAKAGILSHCGRADSGPAPSNMQVADLYGGSMYAMVGILSAIYHREKTGQGQAIDISMCDGAFTMNSMDGAGFLAGGDQPTRQTGLLNGGSIYDYYKTADGRYFSVGSLEPKFYKGLCQAMGLQPSPLGVRDLDQKKEIEDLFASKSSDEWLEIFKDYDICVELVADLDQACKDDLFVERKMLVDLPAPSGEMTIRQIGCPIHMSKTPPEYRHAGYPAGWHTDEILKKKE